MPPLEKEIAFLETIIIIRFYVKLWGCNIDNFGDMKKSPGKGKERKKNIVEFVRG